MDYSGSLYEKGRGNAGLSHEARQFDWCLGFNCCCAGYSSHLVKLSVMPHVITRPPHQLRQAFRFHVV